MSKQLVPVDKRAVRKVDRPAAEVEVVEPVPRAWPFVSFHYSYTEISSVDGKARMSSRKTSLENGKLVSESLDGELERGVYDQMVSQAQRHFYERTSLFLQSLSALLPFSRK